MGGQGLRGACAQRPLLRGPGFQIGDRFGPQQARARRSTFAYVAIAAEGDGGEARLGVGEPGALCLVVVEFDGATRPLYHLFHPTEHGRIWIEAPAADGQPGVGAGGVVARYEWFGPYDSEGAARVVELSPQRFVTRPRVLGFTIGEIRHTWGTSPQGATYSVDTVIGVDWPVVGPWVNALLRRYVFSESMLREWKRHQVEEVGLLPHFLPALYAARNDRNVYRLSP